MFEPSLSARAAGELRRGAPAWRRTGARWIADFPAPTAIGFFCAVLWPVSFALNVLLLAQVLEIVPPGGVQVAIPALGSFSTLSLLAGLLYSIAQTTFAIVAGEAGKDRKQLAFSFMMLLVLSIVAEMSLAGFWVCVLPADGNQMFARGSWLRLFLFFMAPVSQSVLGSIALPRFIGPLIGYLPRLLAGVLLWLCSLLVWFVFGFPEERSAAPGARSPRC